MLHKRVDFVSTVVIAKVVEVHSAWASDVIARTMLFGHDQINAAGCTERLPENVLALVEQPL